jgi:hypothetical protein
MPRTPPDTWVVYRTAPMLKQVGRNAVCTQSEWDAMELAHPGQHTLIRGDIGNEGEAERLARDLQTPPPVPKPPRAPVVRPPVAPVVDAVQPTPPD